ncbi:MAG: HAMP domain-containing histidine kinase [Gemmatimonadota bacterium]|nr:HAMP domain-containing histidine kinase [Gemmatimonadota bacterium]
MALTFRRRIQLALVALGTVPTAIAVIGLVLAVRPTSDIGDGAPSALEAVGETGRDLVRTVDSTHLSAAERRALADHARALNEALSRTRREETYARYYGAGIAAVILSLGALVLYASVRVGGYLSRQLSRPIDELVRWAGHLQRTEPLPPDAPQGGAPEFAELRRALRQAASTLEEARARELEAERLRAFREMARRVAHEMKNPLTPIRFAVRALDRSASAGQREALEVLQAESDRLEQLAREFTEMGRLPEGPAAEVDLGELLVELSQTAVPPGTAITVSADPATPRITGHYEPLRRAFSNLIRNAVEAGAGSAGIELRASPWNQDGAEIRVIDHGPGVPRQLRGQLFEPYVTAGKASGTGLGLALVRQAIESHGGRIRHEDTPGGGATFVVQLPSAPRA